MEHAVKMERKPLCVSLTFGTICPMGVCNPKCKFNILVLSLVCNKWCPFRFWIPHCLILWSIPNKDMSLEENASRPTSNLVETTRHKWHVMLGNNGKNFFEATIWWLGQSSCSKITLSKNIFGERHNWKGSKWWSTCFMKLNADNPLEYFQNI